MNLTNATAIGAEAIITACAAIAFAVYQNYFRKPEPRVVLVSRVKPFSGLPGRESLPAFSPDGRQVAFAWNGGEGETLDIYVRLIGEGEPGRLTTGENNALFPAFSPDGKYVAFSRSFPDTSKIYLVPALGGAERRVAEVRSGGTSFSFSPDGKTIAVADRDSVDSTGGLFFVNIETGAKQRLTGGLAWSADGERIIFSSKRAQASSANLWQVAAAGGEPLPDERRIDHGQRIAQNYATSFA